LFETNKSTARASGAIDLMVRKISDMARRTRNEAPTGTPPC